MSNENLIGHGVCPLCGNTKARFTVSVKRLACMTCNACNCQIFTRSDNSDDRLRAFIRPTAEAVPAPAPAAVPAPAPSPAPAPAPTPTPKTGPSWGIMGAIRG